MNKNKKGFTLVEIMIVVAIIGLLAVIAIPTFQRARANSIESAKVNNIRIVDTAIEQAAMKKGLLDGEAIAATDYYEYIAGANTAADLSSADGPLAVGTALPTLPTLVGEHATY